MASFFDISKVRAGDRVLTSSGVCVVVRGIAEGGVRGVPEAQIALSDGRVIGTYATFYWRSDGSFRWDGKTYPEARLVTEMPKEVCIYG